MFLDASAIIAILSNEPDADSLLTRIEESKGVVAYSPSSLFEAVIGLARRRTIGRFGPHAPVPVEIFDYAERIVREFFLNVGAVELSMDGEVGAEALRAARDFGRGSGHPAQLNFGDCLAYGCAKAKKLPLLFKGNDFVHTDIQAA